MASVHQIIDTIADPDVTYNFEFWRGEPPSLPREIIATHSRPGVDGIAEQKLGSHGRTIRAQLVSHWSSYAAAIAILDNYAALVGKGLHRVVHNNINWFTQFGIKFYVDDMQFVSCRTNVLIVGPDYSFPSGAELTTEWTLTPST